MKKLALLFLFVIISCDEYEISEYDNSVTNTPLQSRLISENNNFPVALDSIKAIGMTGHPFTQDPYLSDNITNQIAKLKEHGCNFYRFEIRPQNIVDPTVISTSDISSITSQGINVLPVIILEPNFSLPGDAIYDQGQAIGDDMHLKLGDLPYYEVGNELSIRCLKTIGERDATFQSGNIANDYDDVRISKVSLMMKGVIDRLKHYNSNCKIVTSNGGYLQNEYFQLLSNNDVQIDIIGVHWYSNMGLMNSPIFGINSLTRLKSYGKPIWITEFGFYEQTNNVQPNEKAQYLIDFINDLSGNNLIQGLFFYQMYFQALPFFDNNPNYPGQILNYNYEYVYPSSFNNPTDLQNLYLWHQNERHYGLCDVQTQTWNLQSDAFKYKIEEIKYGYNDYVYELYNKLLNYNPETDDQPGGIPFHVHVLKTTHNKDATINAFFTAERYYEKFIRNQYAQLLETPYPISSGVNYWKSQMMSPNNMTRENVIINFCNSEQFWTQSSSNISGFIGRLYLKLLNRAPDPVGQSYWINRYNSFSSSTPIETKKSTIINEFIHSDEFVEKFVRKQYADLLSRSNPDAQGVTFWKTQMLTNNMSQVDLMRNFTKSEGFLERSIYDGYERRNSSNQYFFRFGESIFFL